ncbi:MAG TPA: type III pantothenate kinase [Candidatus Limnocylindria bacterium]|nr:type III pantothenate kinase [Candidatus Limnocylindria bacterium]
MRLLAADIGNSNTGLGLFEDDIMVGSWSAETDARATDDELAATVAGLLALDGHRFEDVEAAAVASVVPPLVARWTRMLARRARLRPTIVDAAALDGILDIEIDRPAEAGADRLVNALAAREEFGGPAIVIDLGTSTNFDVLSADGAYVGGAIAPGLGISIDALVGRTSKLPRIELARPPHAIGTNTIAAMQSGTVNGYIGLLSGLLAAIRGEVVEASPDKARVTVIATGGFSLQPWLADVPGIDRVEPELTLRGIRYAYQLISARAEART